MTPREKLHPHIEALANVMRGYLRDAPPVHVTATSRAMLDDDADPEGSALNGGSLKGGKPPPIRHDGSALVAAYRRFFKEAIAAGVPLHLIEFKFHRGEAGWTYDVALETSDAREVLERAREPLDQAVARAMIAAAGGGWSELTFEQRLPSLARFLVTKDEDFREVAISPELEGLLKRAFELYTQHGRELRWPLWRVAGDPRQYDVETQMHYG
ncbi:hypothetical protein [Pyxidicoccus sp. MSG2]|uniref:hypothetical protein n=1 Tax=Pyxidicoccus sp. MSG2 TaxID=2996790 RepID=UPI00226F033F|nr:hypothetical protein [Pyxidicoccus sp. MSG2]MCY1016432.1 hypothetical protein [Pyxidicoccus sp. MSG2]